MLLKTFARAITPPFIWEAVHRIKVWIRPPPPPAPQPTPPPPQPPVHEIRFATWEAARVAAGNYEDQEFTKFRAARFAANLAAGILPPVTDQPLYWLVEKFGADVRVTDYGGAFGDYGVSFLSTFPNASYTVVETPAIVAAAPRGAVQFATSAPAACDIFFTSGTVQYLDDPYAVLREGFASAAKAVVLARNCFSAEDMFRVQESRLFNNGSGAIPEGFDNRTITYPVRTLREAEVSRIAEAAGFSLLLKSPEPAALLIQGVYSAMLVYVRAHDAPPAFRRGQSIP